MKTFRIDSRAKLESLWPAIRDLIKAMVEAGKAFEVIVQEETKTRRQERLAHALMADIVKTARITIDGLMVDFVSYGDRSSEVAKALFVRWFEIERQEQNEPLRRPGYWISDPRTGEKIYSRATTTQFSVSEYSAYIEFLYALGAEYGATFSDPTLAEYEQWMQTCKR